MASTKVTFTLDDATISRLEHAAASLSIPKSEVVREAVRDYAERLGRLSERERLNMLRIFDEMAPRVPVRDMAEVERELKALRRARHSGGRRSLETQ